MSLTYPVGLNLSGKCVVCIGAGSVNSRRVPELLHCGAIVRVAGPKATKELLDLAGMRRIELLQEEYRPDHLDNAFLILIATDDAEVNKTVMIEAQNRGILAARADDADNGDLILPSVMRRGALCIGVTTGGAAPALAAQLTREIESLYGPEYDEYVALMGRCRSRLKSEMTEPAARKKVISELLSQRELFLQMFREGAVQGAVEFANRIIETGYQCGRSAL